MLFWSYRGELLSFSLHLYSNFTDQKYGSNLIDPYLFFFFKSYPCRCHRQWVGCVQTLLSIIDWPAISKNRDLKVLYHRINYLPVQNTQTS